MRWLCIYCNEFLKSVYVLADWKDGVAVIMPKLLYFINITSVQDE